MAQIVLQENTDTPTIISLTRAKKQLRFDDPAAAHEEDDLIQVYLDAAIGFSENYTGQEITEKIYLVNGKSFLDALLFNKQKIQVIESIKYKDVNGDLQTIPADNYYLETVDKYENKIAFSDDFTLPEVQPYKYDAVQITVKVGYAENKVPKNMQVAMLMLMANYYENRQDTVKQKCTAAEDLLSKYRRY